MGSAGILNSGTKGLTMVGRLPHWTLDNSNNDDYVFLYAPVLRHNMHVILYMSMCTLRMCAKVLAWVFMCHKYCKAPDTSWGAPGLTSSGACMLVCYKHNSTKHALLARSSDVTEETKSPNNHTATEKERFPMRQDDVVFLCMTA